MSVEQSVEQTSEETEILQQAYADAKAMQEDISATTPEVTEENEQTEDEPVVEDGESINEENVEPVEEKSDTFKEPIILKDRKLEIPVNNMQELIVLAQKGLNYTQKTQQIATHKNTVDYLGKHNITMEDLETLASLKSGDKQALAHLAKTNKIDMYDIDSEATFNPNEQVRYYEPTEVDIVANEILQNEPVAKKITEWTSNDVLPNDFLHLLRSDANALRAFAEDVESGIADRILPLAVKNYAINKGEFLQSYMGAAQYLASQSQGTQQVQQAVKPVVKNASTVDKAKVSISSNKQSSANAEDDFDVYEDGLSDRELMRRIQIQADRLKNSRKG